MFKFNRKQFMEQIAFFILGAVVTLLVMFGGHNETTKQEAVTHCPSLELTVDGVSVTSIELDTLIVTVTK